MVNINKYIKALLHPAGGHHLISVSMVLILIYKETSQREQQSMVMCYWVFII